MTSLSPSFDAAPVRPLASRVPQELLRIPFAQDRPRTLRYEAGIVLDTQLRRLSRASGAIDRALAMRLAVLHGSNGFVRLGYARFADWARERAGLPVRTAQEWVRLGRALERLPRLAHALAAGHVSWSAACQVARVATSVDEAGWIALAASLPVRVLKARVARALAGERVAADDPNAAGEAAPSSPGGADGEAGGGGSTEVPSDEDPLDPLVLLELSVSGEIARAWYAALELCELVAGAPLTPGEAPEYVLADFLSGGVPVDSSETGFRPSLPLKVPRRGALRSVGRPEASPPGVDLDSRDATRFAPGAELRHALEVADAPVPRDPFGIDASVRALTAARTGLDLDLARLLRNFHMLSLASHLGYRDFSSYVEERLGISVARARFLERLDRRLLCLERIRRAVREGVIGAVAALEIARVAVRGRTEQDWIDRAGRRSVARLREEVAWAEREIGRCGNREIRPPELDRLPSDLEALGDWIASGCEMSARKPDPMGTSRVRFMLPESALSLWTEARARLAVGHPRAFVSDAEVLWEVAVAFLVTHGPMWVEALENGDPIAVRDRFACQVPGCSVRLGSAHHIRFRSQGGPDLSWNLVFLCTVHHLDGVHAGRIRVSGRAPDDLHFELGLRPDGSALERFAGHERIGELAASGLAL
ncbi:MAG TPA: HNH endonuclease signature motif containing protein [Candidatus Polarisedimenticolaceae bacterium]|nr:HNH endonuclease signature motif containing protein [Candidatus Polarisedimenticolaceae bacterium]